MEFVEYLNQLGKFDLDAEVLCLNFANTMDWHASDHPEEGLNNYVDLLLWAIDAGIISKEEAEHLFHLTSGPSRQCGPLAFGSHYFTGGNLPNICCYCGLRRQKTGRPGGSGYSDALLAPGGPVQANGRC